ncbi:MAG TPA: hypothetical protein VGQ76_01950 [Thermoanaerobaculia bacterium]|jgi:hypothetical protein|nr:hypothetical protein [Thermoanaerobaculia bacterium]
MKHFRSLLLVLLSASPALAGEVLIPAVLRGPGANGSVWRSEIVLSNTTTENRFPIVSTVTLHPTGGGAPVSLEVTTGPKQTYVIHDAVLDWFDLEEGSGIVRVTWSEEDAQISARARIYNVSSGGEFGQGVPGLPIGQLQLDNYLPGVSGINGNRTNIGVSNPHDVPVQFWIELFETSGLSRGSFSNIVQPRSYRQFNDIFSWFQAGPLDAAMVRVQAINKTVYPYASIVRADTGDATFVTPAQ